MKVRKHCNSSMAVSFRKLQWRPLQFEVLEDRRLLAVLGDVLYRVNAGGPELFGSPVWEADSAATPASYLVAGNTAVASTGVNINMDRVPAGIPMELFQTERFDKPGPDNMEWDFAVAAGDYEVRLYFAETWSGAFADGVRVFDVTIEGVTVLDNYDVHAVAGPLAGIVETFTVTSDAVLEIDFGRESQNPAIKGIEIFPLIDEPAATLVADKSTISFGNVIVGETSVSQLKLTNGNGPGGSDITIDPSQGSLAPSSGPFTFLFSQASPIVLAPGESTSVAVTYSPTVVQIDNATLTVSHNGSGSTLNVSLVGAGVSQIPIAFEKSVLGNTIGLNRPTSMQFGPDGRLYVSQQNGLIRVYEVVKTAANDYDVVNAETINVIQGILNHDDDGVPRPDITDRLVTGLLVAGTAQNPVIYVGSSDPRIGGGNDGKDTNLDTNSSILSRITWTGSSWDRLDLVRGLPRSDEQHAINGMAFAPDDPTILYVTLGGNTNMGAPSNNFAFLPEYAYSAAILAVDLAAIGETTYDLPTLDDEDQPGADVTDPFGGNNGKNQAILEPNGPVQLYAVGMRNPYDIAFDSQGRMYSVDNGPNAGWGGIPINEGPEGNATNAISESGSATHGDGLHFITGPGYYGGHPNPTRSNRNNTFNVSNPQSPTYFDNPIESDYQEPGVDDLSMVVYPNSTNGLTFYEAGNFGGAMRGDLIIASFDNTIKRVSLNAAGDAIEFSEDLFSNVGFRPLDVIAPATGPFAGTIWTNDIALNTIYVFEPTDGSGGSEDDRDGDGYSNDDEIANGTNPDSPADVPPDFDMDFVSNLLDPDDDNDTIFDEADLFAVDPNNGAATPIGTVYTWENEGEDLGGILGMGFTGLMNNGVDNYESLFDAEAVTAGGAAGVFTVDVAGAGTARGATNTQYQGFQFGFNPVGATGPFSATTRVLAPFGGHAPQPGQAMGLSLGVGDQDNYVQIVLSGDSGGSIQLVSEFGGVDAVEASEPLVLPGPGAVDLWLTVDPLAMTMQASYAIDNGLRTILGGPVSIPSSWLGGALAAGLISVDPAQDSLPVTWDHLGVIDETPSSGGAAAAKVEVYTTGSINNSSTARTDSFRIDNNSTGNRRIESVLIDLNTALMPDLLFDPNGAAGDTLGISMMPGSGVVETGQSTHAFLAPRDGGFEQLRIDFNDFDPSEFFTFRTDVDPTSIKGSDPPGPSNAADVSGLELSGATVTITFDDNTQLTGQVFALDEGVDFYKVHSEVVLTEAPLAAAPGISLLGIATPAVVTSASQTVRVTGVAGAAVRLLQTEVALHLDGTPNGGFDIDPYEANKVVFVSDEVAAIGPTGFVDIPVTLGDTLVEGGITYLTAVIEEPDGRTTKLSNVVKVALNDLPPGSVSGEPQNEAPETSGVTLTPSTANAGPIALVATATDTDGTVAAAEYFIDAVGAEGAGTPLSASDGAFDSASEAIAVTISEAAFNALSAGDHTIFVRAQDDEGAWGAVASATLVKESTSGSSVRYRVNAGGPEVSANPVWTADTALSPSSYGNGGDAASNSIANSTTNAIGMSHPSIPAGTPMAVFQSNRADPPNGTELEWDFDVAPGQYEVRLYFAEIWTGAFSPGARVFDVEVEGIVVLDDYDIYVAAGQVGNAGVVESVFVTADNNLDVNFLRSIRAPQVSAIEVISLSEAAASTASSASLAADFDGSGSVDGRDFLLWQRGLAPTPLRSTDLDDWQSDFGAVEATSTLNDAFVSSALELQVAPVTAGSSSLAVRGADGFAVEVDELADIDSSELRWLALSTEDRPSVRRFDGIRPNRNDFFAFLAKETQPAQPETAISDEIRRRAIDWSCPFFSQEGSRADSAADDHGVNEVDNLMAALFGDEASLGTAGPNARRARR